VAVNVAFDWPAVTLTLPGTVILALLLESVTVAPDGTAAVSVTVQLDVPGAITVAGEQVREPTWTVTVRPMMVDWVTPFKEAVTVTFCALEMFAVVAGNVAEL
jgi:hypothetical protein